MTTPCPPLVSQWTVRDATRRPAAGAVPRELMYVCVCVCVCVCVRACVRVCVCMMASFTSLHCHSFTSLHCLVVMQDRAVASPEAEDEHRHSQQAAPEQ